MRKFIVILAAVALLTACTAQATQPAVQPLATLPANVTPLVTQVGAGVVAPSNHYEAIKQAGVIRVGTSADYPPFEFLDSNGARLGLDIELMEEIGGRMGVLVEWVDLPFEELVGAVQAGRIDAAISAFELTPDRDAQVDFSRAYYTPEDAFIAAPNFTGQIGKPEDAAAYVVGVQAGSAQETWLKETLVQAGTMPETSVKAYEQMDEAVADLNAGSIELIMLDYIPAQSLVQANPGTSIAFHGSASGGPLHIAIPSGDAELAQALDAVIQHLESEGFIQNLEIRYIGAQ